MSEIYENVDLPQLIVGQDTEYEDSNYIHIKDAKDRDYYCPCCKGKIKPRAYKTDIKYKVQPHFYHISGGCTEESYVHYMCKHLLKIGSKFIVDGIIYEVSNIETEKTLHTSFGNYRPDIVVTTTASKVFYIEIENTNKKTTDYIPKWDELGNDVVEIDTRDFINQMWSEAAIPEFELIYSNGQCFIKKYTRQDYDETIAKRKLEWKRQDKLNYKMQWERLDWFWCDLQDYFSSEDKEEKIKKVFNSFNNMEIFDQTVCFNMLKKHNGIKIYNNNFRKMINDNFIKYFSENKVKELIEDKDVDFVIVNIIPKDYISITCVLKDICEYDCEKYSVRICRDFKKWVLDYDFIIGMIQELKIELNTKDVKEEQNKNKFIYEKFFKAYNPYKEMISKKKHCIWYIEDELKKDCFGMHDCFEVTIGIKQGNSYEHCKTTSIYMSKTKELTVEEIEEQIVSKFTNMMNKIRNYVMRYDGYYDHIEYRHIFADKEIDNG